MTRKRHVTEEEAQLFAHAMKDVRPARSRAKKRALAEKPKPPKLASAAPLTTGSAKLPARPLAAKSKDSPPPAIDRRTEQKLKRGRIEIDATLDLHGLKQHAAHSRLVHFIARASEDGHKAVLIVTGKGTPRGEETSYMPGERRGVLRAQVPLWLEEAPLRAYVRGVKSAGPRHGGAGALYVLIKRRNSQLTE